MPVSASRKAAALLFFMAALAGGLAILVSRLDAEARDRDAVRAFVRDMEQNLLTRDGIARLLSEAALAQQGPPKTDGEHGNLRTDVERLACLDGLQILLDNIDVQPQGAMVDYRVVGRPRPGNPPPPFGGRLVLRRAREGWRFAANRFLEEPPKDSNPAPAKRRLHQPTHAGLAARLGMIAALALLSAAVVLIQALPHARQPWPKGRAWTSKRRARSVPARGGAVANRRRDLRRLE